MIVQPDREYLFAVLLEDPRRREELGHYLHGLFEPILFEIEDSAQGVSGALGSLAQPAKMTGPSAASQAMSSRLSQRLSPSPTPAPRGAPAGSGPSTIHSSAAARARVELPGGGFTRPSPFSTTPAPSSPPGPGGAPGAPEGVPGAPGAVEPGGGGAPPPGGGKGGGGGGGGGGGEEPQGAPPGAPPEPEGAQQAPEPEAPSSAQVPTRGVDFAQKAIRAPVLGYMLLRYPERADAVSGCACAGAGEEQRPPRELVRFVGRPRGLWNIGGSHPFGPWAPPIELFVPFTTPPNISTRQRPLIATTTYDARLLSPPGSARSAKNVIDKIGLVVATGPIKLRTGVKTPRAGGRGMDEWLVSFVWTRAATVCPRLMGPFIVEDLAPRSHG